MEKKTYDVGKWEVNITSERFQEVTPMEQLPEDAEIDISDLLTSIQESTNDPELQAPFDRHEKSAKFVNGLGQRIVKLIGTLGEFSYEDVPQFWKDQADDLYAVLKADIFHPDVAGIAKFLYHQYDNLLH